MKPSLKMPMIRKQLALCLLGAGEIIARGIRQKKKIRYKDTINLLTETDRQAESFIIRKLHRRFPDHGFLAEESGVDQRCGITKWIIDPLDGTTNFAHGFPHCCVSIALEHHGKIKIGGVYDPFRKELFWAEKGKGAYLNRKRIHASQTPSLNEALLCTGFPYDR